MEKKKNILLFIVIFSVVLLIGAGTYAYWTWNSNTNKNLVFNTSSDISKYVVYDEGKSYFVGDFQPYSTFCESANTTISFYKTKKALDIGLTATVKMDVNSIGENISLSNDVYWIVTYGDSAITCTNGLDSDSVLAYGTFNGVTVSDDGTPTTLTLLEDVEVTTEPTKLTVWIWIDSNGSNLGSLSGETVDTNIWTQIDMYESQPSRPELDDGMIPITISDDGTVKTVSKNSPDWYDYSNKEWANVVLVTDDSRSKYLNTSKVTVSEADILAYYVWIPRYKYKIWTTTTSTTGKEQTIEIVFENSSTPKSSGTKVGEYRTHPAFTFGNYELDGIWVGKFETSNDATTPKIVPNVASLRNQDVSTQFQTSLKFAGGTLSNGVVSFEGNNTYGLTADTDSHMMKNSEWGAVAYLSHSEYGINEEIYINNSSSYYTGRSGGAVGGISTATYGSYNWVGQPVTGATTYGEATDRTLGTKASTTGNVTGVYDMSGGTWEYVMGVLSDSEGKPRSGYDSSRNSGFNGALYSEMTHEEGTYEEGIAIPDFKYYDLYLQSEFTGDYNTNLTLCNLDTCGGHALSETASWYQDYAYFVNASYPWFLRGGRFFDNVYGGVFHSYYSYGIAGIYSWRSVLIQIPKYTVTFNANGGSGAPVSQVELQGTDVILSSTIPTRTGYTFLGWGTSPSDTSATYQPGYIYSADNSITLYALWRINKVYINYHANDGTLTNGTSGDTFSLTDNLVYKNGLIYTDSISYGGTVNSSSGITNYNNGTNFIISMSGYYAPSGAEWICESGCTTANKTYNQGTTTYRDSDFCDASNGDCTVVVKVNWLKLLIPISSYSCNNDSSGSAPYQLTYSGNCTMVNDGSNNWRVKFLSGGTLTVSYGAPIDVFLVGGGAGGSTNGTNWGGGGGGGYTKTIRNYSLAPGSISITIGDGGAINTDGGTTYFGNEYVNGGKASNSTSGGDGGSGGGGGTNDTGGKAGGSDGSNGSGSGGTGQGGTTREFGESSGTLYAGGGGGGCYTGGTGKGGDGGGGNGNSYQTAAKNGSTNTGGGGGGGYRAGSSYGPAGKGGSGIVIIRNAR